MIWKKKKKTLVLQEKFLGKFQYFMKILRQMLQNIFAYSYCFRRFLERFFFKKKIFNFLTARVKLGGLYLKV